MLGLLGYAYGKSERRAEAVEICQELLKRVTTEYVPAYFIAQVFMGVGKKKDALDWLQIAFLSDHFKSGQRLSLQNRPTGLAVQD